MSSVALLPGGSRGRARPTRGGRSRARRAGRARRLRRGHSRAARTAMVVYSLKRSSCCRCRPGRRSRSSPTPEPRGDHPALAALQGDDPTADCHGPGDADRVPPATPFDPAALARPDRVLGARSRVRGHPAARPVPALAHTHGFLPHESGTAMRQSSCNSSATSVSWPGASGPDFRSAAGLRPRGNGPTNAG